jgi:hypothetical protein
MAKLTLSVQPQVVAQAKRYASHRKISVSSLVESYLSALGDDSQTVSTDPPVLRKLRGVLKTGDVADYRQHLANKYL